MATSPATHYFSPLFSHTQLKTHTHTHTGTHVYTSTKYTLRTFKSVYTIIVRCNIPLASNILRVTLYVCERLVRSGGEGENVAKMLWRPRAQRCGKNGRVRMSCILWAKHTVHWKECKDTSVGGAKTCAGKRRGELWIKSQRGGSGERGRAVTWTREVWPMVIAVRFHVSRGGPGFWGGSDATGMVQIWRYTLRVAVVYIRGALKQCTVVAGQRIWTKVSTFQLVSRLQHSTVLVRPVDPYTYRAASVQPDGINGA